mmetsp:Transcript_37274/g.106621  ORF Transcript_37274/g.106621 Transcript_37274/m.106621 type:complete len:102 (+) Transcript_37274:225-530(+)
MAPERVVHRHDVLMHEPEMMFSTPGALTGPYADRKRALEREEVPTVGCGRQLEEVSQREREGIASILLARRRGLEGRAESVDEAHRGRWHCVDPSAVATKR